VVKKDNITIQDVADRAGVSIMTVSRVMSKKANVKEATRRKILDAIAELNYQPNVAARSLAGSGSYFLGLIYDNPNAAYLSQILMGALHKCTENGYHLIINAFERKDDGHYEIDKNLIGTSKVSGVIIPPPLCDAPEILSALTKANIPIVRIAPQTQPNRSPFVTMDDRQAAYDMTEYLIDLGHRKIGFIKGHPDHGASDRRYDGMRAALKKHDIPLPDDYIQQGYFSYKSGITCAENLLNLAERPTAIFASNDDMAAATISMAQKHGLIVPDDLSVVGFDDVPLASSIWPELTTIRQPIMAMAEKAAEFLMFPDNEAEKDNILDYKLIIRESASGPLKRISR